MAKYIFLETSDGKKIRSRICLLQKSEILSDLLCQVDAGDDREEKTLPLPQVTSSALNCILEWLEYHNKEENEHLEVKNIWAVKFGSKLDDETLFETITASDFLIIPDLFEVLCKEAADRLDTPLTTTVILHMRKEKEEKEKRNQPSTSKGISHASPSKRKHK